VERRRAVRYKLCLPLVFKWADESGTLMQEAGFSRDISTGGLYVSCVKCPPVGATIHLQIVLPPNADIRSHGLRLDATVQVTRMASELEEKGFGAAGDLGAQKANTGTTEKSRIHSRSPENPTLH
jgi:hypothetical protein